MKRLLPILFVLIPACTRAETFAAFWSDIRITTKIYSQSILPDSTLKRIAARSVVYTSTDIGGVEARFSIKTVADRAFYQLPDTTVDVVHASLVSGSYTKSIRAFRPEFSEDSLKSDHIEGQTQDDVPKFYSYWNDTIQLINTPKRSSDTIKLSLWVQHPYDTLASSTIRLKASFREAAFYYAISRIWLILEEYEKADLYMKLYESTGKRAADNARRKVDILPGGQP